jgi:hypothetical protein
MQLKKKSWNEHFFLLSLISADNFCRRCVDIIVVLVRYNERQIRHDVQHFCRILRCHTDEMSLDLNVTQLICYYTFSYSTHLFALSELYVPLRYIWNVQIVFVQFEMSESSCPIQQLILFFQKLLALLIFISNWRLFFVSFWNTWNENKMFIMKKIVHWNGEKVQLDNNKKCLEFKVCCHYKFHLRLKQ